MIEIVDITNNYFVYLVNNYNDSAIAYIDIIHLQQQTQYSIILAITYFDI